jgi:hypothetical protein
MRFSLILRCMRHPRAWRQCVNEAVKADPEIAEWRSERYAAVISTKRLNRGDPIMVNGVEYNPPPPRDPITQAVMGRYPPRRRQTPRTPRKPS